MATSICLAGQPRSLSVDHEEERQISRARSGDPTAIDWLLNRYRDRVLRLATHVLRRSGEAEDVTQEAFVKAFRNLAAYNGEGSFYTWIYRIVVRTCLERQRLARWRREMPIDAAEGLEQTPQQDSESRLMVEALLDRLKPPMRAMLVLRELEGLDYEEIAEVLQIPIGRVKWRLHTARAQFEALLHEASKEMHHV